MTKQTPKERKDAQIKSDTKVNQTAKKNVTDETAAFFNNLRKGFETDIGLETRKGVAIDYGRFGTFVMLRAINRNTKYLKAVQKELTPFLLSVDAMKDPDEETLQSNEVTARKLMAGIYVETVIIGLKTPGGVSLPYNAETKKELAKILASAPDLFQRVQEDAQSAANFRRVEDEAKN